MASEDLDKELLGLSKIVSSVVSKDSESKRSSSIVDNTKKESEEVDPNLKGSEKERLKEIVKILGKELKIGIYEDKPEAKRLKDLTPDKKQALPSQLPGAISDKVKKPQQDKKFGWLDALGLLGGLAALAYMFKDEIKKFWDKHKDKIKDFLKGIGGEINKFWEENKEGIKQAFKDMLSGMFSALLGAMTWAWEEGSAAAKARLIQSVAKPLLPKGSKAPKTPGAVPTPKTPGTTPTPKPPGAVPTPKTPGAVPTPKTPGAVPKPTSGGQYRDPKTGRFAKRPSVLPPEAPNVKPPAAAPPRAVGRAGAASADEAGGMLKKLLPKLLKTVGGAGKLLKGVLKFPLLAETVELGVLIKRIGDERKKYDRGEITQEQLQETVGKLGLNSAGGIIGANVGRVGGYMLGAGLGGLISGAVVGGTGGVGLVMTPALLALTKGLGIAGSIGGAFAGDMAGRWLSDLLTSMADKKTIQDVGVNVLDLYSSTWADKTDPRFWFDGKNKDFSNKPEMQDFMVRGNEVYPFSNKDDLMGLKTGGAIDNVFKHLTEGISKDNSTIKDASIAQVNRLDHLIKIMGAFLQKSGSQGGDDINISNGNNYIPSTEFNLREAFNSQTLLPLTHAI